MQVAGSLRGGWVLVLGLIAYVRCCLWVRAVGLLAGWLFVVVGWIGVFEFVFSCVLWVGEVSSVIVV